MKLVSFHLMPYRPLDLAEAAKHRSPWVVLPNRLYDPVKGADEYARHLDALVYAEELGFDAIGVNEHHQTAYGLMPAPNLIASALIQRTKKIQIAILGRALPLVNNPIYIAEEFAMLDVMSRGRIIAGFVRGIGSEYHSSGVNPYFSHERFHEAHDLIIRAWTEPGPFAFHGDHFSLQYATSCARPYQTPRPPVWIPSQGSVEQGLDRSPSVLAGAIIGIGDIDRTGPAELAGRGFIAVLSRLLAVGVVVARDQV